MIESREFTRRAMDLGLREDHVRRDYVLNHMLASISVTFGEFVFRGGTALSRVYWPDFRLSEDLDFIVEGMPPDAESRLGKCVEEATQRTTWQLQMRKEPARRRRHRFIVMSEIGELLVDIQSDERPYQPIMTAKLSLPYSDLTDEEHNIATVALSEILGNKWFMLDDTDRKEPRDLYDLWAGIKLFGVTFEQIAVGHKARYGYFPIADSLHRARGLEDLWKLRLSHQVTKLPPFHQALSDITASFNEWKSHREP